MKLRTPKKKRDGWALLETFVIGTKHDPMMARHRLIRVPWFGVYVHEIHRPDADRVVHDHPWPFASLILSGGYREQHTHVRERLPGGEPPAPRTWRRWSCHRMRLHDAHYIDQVHGRLVTLVFAGRKQQEWGFYPGREFVPWRRYLSKGGVNPGPHEAGEDYL